jgi:hypothetical protein
MRPKLNIKPYNIFEAYQQRYKEPINPGSVPANYTFTGEQLGIEEPVKQQQPVAAPRQTEPKVSGALSGFFSGLTGRRREWPGSANAGRSGAIGYLGSMYTSPEEEERYLRQSQNKTKLMAVADALRQFGNIYYTSRYATPQKFNDIYAQERARYLQDKAVRDRNNVYYAQQKQREAQLEMQREKIAADAERRNEELAMKREEHKARLPYYTNQAKEAKHKAEIKEKEAANYDKVLKNKNDYDEAKVGATKAREKASLASAERARVAAANDTRRTNSTIAKNARTGSGGGGGKGVTYATDEGYIKRGQAFNDTELAQWENWLRETKQLTPEYEAKLRNAKGAERKRILQYAVGYSLEHNPKAKDYATNAHGAAQTKTVKRNTQKKATKKTQAAGKSNAAGKENSENSWEKFSIHKK